MLWVMPKTDSALRKHLTHSCGECELQIVGAKAGVFDSCVDHICEERWLAEQIFRYPKPKAEQLLVKAKIQCLHSKSSHWFSFNGTSAI